jgi:putative membrane protein
MRFSADPLATLMLCAVALCCAAGLRRRRAPKMRVVACLAGGLAAILIALLSPIDAESERLVSIHMTQHLLLVMAAAPLLVCGRFGAVLLSSLPRAMRRPLGSLWGALHIRITAASASIVWLLFVGLFILWHMPGPYRAALAHESLHVAEHASLLLSALAFWLVALAPPRRFWTRGASILFIATAAVASALPGALIFFAPRPLYVAATSELSLSLVMQDQQYAGLIMWIAGGFVYLHAIARLFLEMMRADPPAPKSATSV